MGQAITGVITSAIAGVITEGIGASDNQATPLSTSYSYPSIYSKKSRDLEWMD